MTQPAHQPAWHPDPWGQAELRWHDGSEWTGHVHGTPTTEPAAAAAPTPPAAPSVTTALAAEPTAPAERPRSGHAIAALVLGVCGIPVAPLVLGIMARRAIAESGDELRGRAMAMAGIVLGVLHTLWATAVLLMLVLVAAPLVGGGQGSAASAYERQKVIGEATRSKAQVKQVVNAVETCAAAQPDGSYGGCGAAAASRLEPDLATSLAACGSPGGACLELLDEGQGYSVTVSGSGSTATASFTERHLASGTIEKTCTVPVDLAAACPGGTWG